MHFSSSEISASMAYKLLVSTVLPRPIAFVTSVNAAGLVNAAPFSFFNVMGSAPPTVVLGFQPNSDGSVKDTPRNILETKQFVVNMVDEALSGQMNIAAASFPPDVSEIDMAGLETSPSLAVRAPRITASPISMECTLLETVTLAGGGYIMMGEVLHFHIDDAVISSTNPLRIDIDKFAPISRLSGAKYGRITDQFEIKRPD